jgi:vacuolar-type H+-ATPase subunit H
LLSLAFFSLAITFFVIIHKSKKQLKTLTTEINLINTEKSSLNQQLNQANEMVDSLTQKNQRLSVYQHIIDVKAEAANIIAKANLAREEAQNDISIARGRADKILIDAMQKANKDMEFAKSESKRIISEASAKKAETIQSAELKSGQLVNDAKWQADKILSNARADAEKVAGNALDARDNAEKYIKLEKTMRNVIKGYGSEYIVPSLSVLDDLADEYNHKEAGEKLKEIRSMIRNMVKNDQAADCSYVEQNRRDTAIRFVVDAFNGKVDSAMSRVKHDNYGIIKAEIEGAFTLVNSNGEAFRNAHIKRTYLDARLEELKWAVAAYELKRLDQEEQRSIREQMREEEKARREIEKAIAESEKEERILQKALQKAREELAKASDEQKQQYEAQLAELETKLLEAEAKGQRALSMAQQTRIGHVYVISNIGSFGEDVYKIGMTRRLEPMDRVIELGDASVPFPFDVHAMIKSDDAPTLEKHLHKHFMMNQVNKINPRKEFFKLRISNIKKAVDDLGIEAHWTLTSDAREYRESLAMVAPIAITEAAYEKDIYIMS